MSGRLIHELVNKKMTAGVKVVDWDGLDNAGNPVSGGVYFYRIQAEDISISRKMVLLKQILTQVGSYIDGEAAGNLSGDSVSILSNSNRVQYIRPDHAGFRGW